jgi:hypothetical protein
LNVSLAHAVGVVVIFSAAVHAEESSPRHLLTGTWTLLRAEILKPDGTIVTDPDYGPDAKGLLIVDGTGRYSLQIFRPGRPKFASGDKTRGTTEEYQAAVLGISTHTGRIVVDTVHNRLIFQIDHAAYPNWEQTEQKREYDFRGDELTYKVPPVAGGTSAISVWRRAESPAAPPSSRIDPAKSLDLAVTSLERQLVPLAEAMPPDRYTFAPSSELFRPEVPAGYTGVRTFAQQLAHLIQTNNALFLGVRGQKSDANFAARQAAIGALTSKGDLMTALKDSIAEAHSAVATLTFDNAWEQAGRDPQFTRAEEVTHAVAHAMDIYGQLVEYGRMNGVVPPASRK